MQGHALGVLIAVHMAGAMLIAFVEGMLAAINSYLPIFTSALMALICALILVMHFKQSTRKNRLNC